MERRLSAILAADVVGYSALMEQDSLVDLTGFGRTGSTVLGMTKLTRSNSVAALVDAVPTFGAGTGRFLSASPARGPVLRPW
jgi:hypothetical protein